MPLTIAFHFYRNFVWITSCVTAFECFLLWGATNRLFILTLLFTKLATEVFIAGLFIFFQSNRWFFYHNLGLTKFTLLGSALTIDLIIWSIAITATTLIA